jgi:hypothetical protein
MAAVPFRSALNVDLTSPRAFEDQRCGGGGRGTVSGLRSAASSSAPGVGGHFHYRDEEQEYRDDAQPEKSAGDQPGHGRSLFLG